MVTKIKPYRIRDVNEPEEWNSLQYNDPNTFARWEGGGWGAYVAWENIQINWNVISATDTIYNAGEWIEIWTIKDYSAMRWPCPEGFHVPLITEWQWLKTIMDWLSLTTWDSWRTNLHMPFAGNRLYNDGAVYDQGSNARYWSSSPRGGSSRPNDVWLLAFNSSYVNPSGNITRAYGLSLRCFKDSYITPDSTWTVVQWTLWSAWIFWNQTEWLISITNWTTGYTIMDKNLWATTVYNNGDTLTQANMWNMYQWWNNYWFPSTWTISNTSPTQVDASDYWPNTENWYYSSDTFIKWNNDWSSVQNDDLWWWVTWVVTLNNAIINTGVLSVNGQTWHVIVESWWKQSFFKTQDEYDALPASKNTDGNLYIIVDSHFNPMPFAELIQLTPVPSAILAELNTYPKDYAEYYYDSGDIEMDEIPSSDLPRADAYMKIYNTSIPDIQTWFIFVDTNLTEQELIDTNGFSQEEIEAILAWERFEARGK